MVRYFPLVPIWATYIYKFQGNKASFDNTDVVDRVIGDVSDLA